MPTYVQPFAARHREEFVNGVEQLRIPLRRNWFAVAFLLVWLAGWSVGGVAAMYQLTRRFDSFLAIWLCGWALGWVFATTSIISQLGAERLRVVHGSLEISTGLGPLRRTWRYDGSAISDLGSAETSLGLIGGLNRVPYPFFVRPRAGAVRFVYGADTVFVAQGVGEPEGRSIAEWLRERLPKNP